MTENEIRKRVEKIEQSLTPQQAILVAIDKAISQFASPGECEAWLSQHPDDFLLGDPREVMAAVSKQLRKESVQTRMKAVARSLRRRVLLAGLWRDCNCYIADIIKTKSSCLQLAAEKIYREMDRIDNLQAVRESWRIAVAEPYPLDPEQAAAVQAACNQHIQEWETLVACDLPDWVQAEPASEPGKSAHELEQAVRALIESGEVGRGAALDLGPIPLSSLGQAPLVDGEWIERHLVELAELGARATEQGLELMVTDDHFLAPFSIGRLSERGEPIPVNEKLIAALRDDTNSALAKFAGRTREIEGRSYLHIDDYRGWAGRRLQSDLQPLEGVVVSSWNDWIDRQGGEGKAELGGIKVRKLKVLVEPSDFIVCSDPAESRLRLQQRRLRLEEIRSLQAKHEASEARIHIKEMLETLLEDLLTARSAIATISALHFGGHAVLFTEDDQRLRSQIELAETLADLYNQLLDLQYVQDPLSKIDISKVKQAADRGSEAIVDRLISAVKSEIKAGVANAQRARDICNASLSNP